jgi:hypothetical protein
MIDDDVNKKLRLHQVELIHQNTGSISFSMALNHALRISLGRKNV